MALAAVGAAHGLQDPRRAGLKRQVRMLTDRGTFRHRFDHRPAEVLRVRAREADPLDPVDGVAGAQELAELDPGLERQVSTVRVHVLAEEGDLTHARAREALDLGRDLPRAAALLAAANGGDDAV